MKRIKLTPILPIEVQQYNDYYLCAYCEELATCRCTKSIDSQGYWEECGYAPTCREHSMWYKGKPYCVNHFPLANLYKKLSQLDKRKRTNFS